MASPVKKSLSDEEILALENKTQPLKALSDEDIISMESKPKNKMSSSEAAAIKFTQGGTLGLRPIAAGLGGALGESIGLYQGLQDKPVIEKLKYVAQNFPTAFKESREKAISEQDLAQKEYPVISTVANIAGGAVPTAVFAPLRAAGILGGAQSGAIQGVGESIGSAKTLEDAVSNIGFGAAAGGVGGAIGKGISAVGNKLSSKAEEAAVSALGIDKRSAKQLLAKDQVNTLGRTILDNDVISSIPKNHATMLNDVEGLIQKYGAEYGDVIKDLDNAIVTGEAKGISRADIANNLRAKFLSKVDNPTTRASNRVINKFIDTFEKLNPDGSASGPDKIYSFSEAQSEKKAAEEIAKSLYNKLPGLPTSNKEVVNAALANEFKNQIENVTDPNSIKGLNISKEEFIKLKQAFGSLKAAEDILFKKEAGNMANRLISPSDYGAGAVGAMIGASTGDTPEEKIQNALTGLLLGGVNKLGRTYGSQVLANTLNKAGKNVVGVSRMLPSSLGQTAANLNAIQRRKQQLEGAQ